MAGKRRTKPPPSGPAESPSADDTQIVASGPAACGAEPRPSLLVVQGLSAGRCYTIENRELTLGRGPDCGIVLDDPGVSRAHARLTPRPDGTVSVADLQSANGTFVNGKRIGSAVLASGDRLRLGAAAMLTFAVRDRLERECLQQLYDSALRDPLTGVANKRFLLERLEQEFAYCRRRGLPLSVLMIDIDRFKQINDEYGHTPAGDQVLKTFAETVRGTVRSEDVLGRFGGEEFLLILRTTSSTDAVKLAERLRRLIETTEFAAADLRGNPVRVPVTVSIGAATLQDGNYGSAQALLSAADQRHYWAKREGRNRVAGTASQSGTEPIAGGSR